LNTTETVIVYCDDYQRYAEFYEKMPDCLKIMDCGFKDSCCNFIADLCGKCEDIGKVNRCGLCMRALEENAEVEDGMKFTQ